MCWKIYFVYCGGLVGRSKKEVGMDDYKGKEIDEKKDGKYYF